MGSGLQRTVMFTPTQKTTQTWLIYYRYMRSQLQFIKGYNPQWSSLQHTSTFTPTQKHKNNVTGRSASFGSLTRYVPKIFPPFVCKQASTCRSWYSATTDTAQCAEITNWLWFGRRCCARGVAVHDSRLGVLQLFDRVTTLFWLDFCHFCIE